MLQRCRRGLLALGAALAIAGYTLAAAAGPADVPPPGKSPTIDAIKKRGALRAAAIGEFPWLPENTSGSGPQFSGPAWVLANEYAKRLGVKLDIVPVSHETKVPILATGDADISIAPLSVTPQRQKVVDFIVYSKSSLCFFGRADNPKLKDVKTRRRPEPARHHHGLLQRHAARGLGADPLRQGEVPRRRRLGRQRAGRGDDEQARRHRARSTTPAVPQLEKQVPGLVVFPKGDECFKSHEMPTAVGLAVDKKDPVFRDWLQAVYEEVKDKVTAEELKILKGGA